MQQQQQQQQQRQMWNNLFEARERSLLFSLSLSAD
jgi:hypothetical protein